MKLCTFEPIGGTPGHTGLAIVKDGGLIPLAQTAPNAPRTMIGLINAWAVWQGPLSQIAARGGPLVRRDAVRLRAPIVRPGKILAIGLNYADHVRETGRELPEHQTWFCKQPLSAAGPDDPVEVPKVSAQLDYEAELVVVIGRRGKHIARDQALNHVFGYAAGNDYSVRDWQRLTTQWIIGKGFDGHAPFGPWITTADEVPDPHALGIRAFVNGEKRQDSNTAELIFRIEDQIAFISQAMTLEPGDLIFTGTPSGVAMAMSPPAWLVPGDRVQVEIDGLGALDNKIVAEA